MTKGIQALTRLTMFELKILLALADAGTADRYLIAQYLGMTDHNNCMRHLRRLMERGLVRMELEKREPVPSDIEAELAGNCVPMRVGRRRHVYSLIMTPRLDWALQQTERALAHVGQALQMKETTQENANYDDETLHP